MTAQATTEKAFAGYLSQSEVNYVPLSATPGKACANCRWFMNDGCFIVECYEPEPIIATGYCDRWEASPAPAADATETLVEAIEEMAETISESVGYVEMERTPKKTLAQRFRALLPKSKPRDDAFSVFKGSDGQWHWHAVFTNNFEDLEGEILTEKAHDNYIARLDAGLVPMPVLMAWHTPGSEHGMADVVWRNDHFVHAIGHFDDTPQAEKAIAFYRKNTGKLKMSHGFTAPEWAFDGKHYEDYNTLEITTLPPYAAANPYTSFEELMTMQKTMSEEKLRYLQAVVGKDKAAEIVAADEQRGKALEDMRIAYKDYANLTPDDGEDETDDGDDESRKALSAVYGDLATGMSELTNIVTMQAKALEAERAAYKALDAKFEAQTAAWQKELDELRTVVNMPPRRASQDMSTVRKEGEKLENVIPADDPKTNFWSSMGVAVKGNAQ